MSSSFGTPWSGPGPKLPPAVRAALREHADHDAARLHVEPQSYRRWLVAALDGAEDAGPTRAALANATLTRRSLFEAVESLLEVAQLRRSRAADLEAAEALAAWTDAELRITAAVAQARDEDPASARNRLAALGKAAGTLGHELRNPLGVIQSSVYLLGRRAAQDDKARRHVEKIGRHATICHRIIEDLMHLARNAPPRLESLDVSEAFALAVDEAGLPPGVECSIEAPPGLRVRADAGLLQRALVNLLRNAGQAMRGTGTLRMGVDAGQEAVTLWVRDDGPGFEASMLHDAFDPLATTSGVGLGLALVESVMRRHDGEANARNENDGGARVDLRFPQVPRPGIRDLT